MLPTTLRIAGENRLMREPDVTMNPFSPSKSERIGNSMGSAILQILNAVEQGKQQQRQKSIIENILAGKPEEEWVPQAKQSAQPESLLGRVLQGVGGIFDLNQAPAHSTPIENALAQRRLQSTTQQPKITKLGNKLVKYDPRTGVATPIMEAAGDEMKINFNLKS